MHMIGNRIQKGFAMWVQNAQRCPSPTKLACYGTTTIELACGARPKERIHLHPGRGRGPFFACR